MHVVLDNASTHKTPAIKRWLAAHPRFVLHFTPTSSSWLNLVERWFGELTTKKLQRGTHRSVRALNKDIRDWIGTWNDDPKPYVWTKTADQILDSVSIKPGARHHQTLLHPHQRLTTLGASDGSPRAAACPRARLVPGPEIVKCRSGMAECPDGVGPRTVLRFSWGTSRSRRDRA